MTIPRISVLIPTYNYARYLPEAIESVLEQDFQDFELLVSDNGSTDGSTEIISGYAAQDSRVRFHAHPANLGMVQNFNWCLSQARGEFIKFLASDDKLASRQALTRLVELLDTNASATLAASARFVIGENSEVLETWNDFGKPGLHPGTEVIACCLDGYRNLVGEPSAVMFRRRDASRGFNPRYRQLVDLEMWFHLLERGDFAYTSGILCCFRRHAQQQTEANKAGQIAERDALRLLGEYCAKPYLRKKGFRERQFAMIYDLRKRRKRDAHVPLDALQAEQELSAQMNRFRYAVYCSRRRIARPFQNLERWCKQHWFRAEPAEHLRTPTIE
jgi:glycosyltransferase involved in cell wall biosynthesis